MLFIDKFNLLTSIMELIGKSAFLYACHLWPLFFLYFVILKCLFELVCQYFQIKKDQCFCHINSCHCKPIDFSCMMVKLVINRLTTNPLCLQGLKYALENVDSAYYYWLLWIILTFHRHISMANLELYQTSLMGLCYFLYFNVCNLLLHEGKNWHILFFAVLCVVRKDK